MTGLHFKWVPCPECGSNEVYDVGADDAPTFSFECRSCGADWEQAGIAFRIGPDEIEGVAV